MYYRIISFISCVTELCYSFLCFTFVPFLLHITKSSHFFLVSQDRCSSSLFNIIPVIPSLRYRFVLILPCVTESSDFIYCRFVSFFTVLQNPLISSSCYKFSGFSPCGTKSSDSPLVLQNRLIPSLNYRFVSFLHCVTDSSHCFLVL